MNRHSLLKCTTEQWKHQNYDFLWSDAVLFEDGFEQHTASIISVEKICPLDCNGKSLSTFELPTKWHGVTTWIGRNLHTFTSRASNLTRWTHVYKLRTLLVWHGINTVITVRRTLLRKSPNRKFVVLLHFSWWSLWVAWTVTVMAHQSATRRYKNFHGEWSLNTLPLDTWQGNPTAHCVHAGTVCVVNTPTSWLLLQFVAQRYNNGYFVL